MYHNMTERSPTMFAWGRAFGSILENFNRGETALVRMFRIEYPQEYRHLKRNGCEINDRFVKDFLDVR